MATDYPLYVAGQWQEGTEPLTVHSPYDGAAVGSTTWAGPDLVEEAIAGAVAARQAIARLSAMDRHRALSAVATRMETERQELVHLIALEAGKPLKQATAEFDRALLTIRTGAEEAQRFGGDLLPLDVTAATRGHLGLVRRFPIGPVLGISPFNFPLNLAMHKVAAALAAGNPIVLKPAPKTPLTWLFMARLFAEVDLPPGALSVLVCSTDLATRMVEDERFKMVSFTGSAAVGWALKARAGKKRVTLELGGNAGAIVDTSADLAQAAQKLAVSAFGYAGQSCISAQRIFALERVNEEFTGRLVAATQALKVGDPLDPETEVGPLVEPAALQRVQEWLAEARSLGARVLTGGETEGNILYPTILAGAPPQARVCSQEVFAPVVNVSACSTFEEAVTQINASPYGLQAALFTQDLAHTLYAYRELEVGGVIVNEASSYRMDPMPYGGVKDSGFGREGLRYAMEEMTEPRLLVLGGSA